MPVIDTLDKTEAARKVLEDKQGKDIRVLDVRGISGVTDFYLIASGTSAPHLKAMFTEVELRLKERGVRCFRKSGMPDGGWLVLDYFDIVIHILSEEAREYYALEELWAGTRPE